MCGKIHTHTCIHCYKYHTNTNTNCHLSMTAFRPLFVQPWIPACCRITAEFQPGCRITAAYWWHWQLFWNATFNPHLQDHQWTLSSLIRWKAWMFIQKKMQRLANWSFLTRLLHDVTPVVWLCHHFNYPVTRATLSLLPLFWINHPDTDI